MTQPHSANASPLPVVQTISAAAAALAQRRGDLIDYALPGVVILAVLGTTISLSAGPVAPTQDPNDLEALERTFAQVVVPRLLLFLPSLYFITTFLVGWTRLWLLPKEKHDPMASLRWQPRHTRFVGYLIVLVILVFAFTLFGSIFVNAAARTPAGILAGLTVMVFIGAVLVAARFSTVLPAAAIDHAIKLGESWSLTRGHGPRVFAVFALSMLLVELVLSVTEGILVLVFGGSTSFMGVFVREFTSTLLRFAGLAFLMGVAVGIFDHLRINRPPSVDLTIT